MARVAGDDNKARDVLLDSLAHGGGTWVAPEGAPNDELSALALAFSYWSIQGSGYQTVYYGLFVVLLGLPVYLWLRRSRGEYGRYRGGQPGC